EGEPLALAAGERARGPAGELEEPDLRERLVRLSAALLPGDARERQAIGHVGARRAPEHHGVLEHHGLPPAHPALADTVVRPDQAARAGREQPMAEPQQQALACAVVSKDYRARSRLEPRGDAVDEPLAAGGEGKALEP